MALTIDVWSDYLCPYCYVTSRSLAVLKQRYDIDLRYHLFEIKRTEPVERLDKRSTLIDVLRPTGSMYHQHDPLLKLKQGPTDISSRPALIATLVAGSHGRMHHYYHRVMRAYWEEGRAIDRTSVLVQLAADVGLDRYTFSRDLRAQHYSSALAADLNDAHYRDIEHVPTLVFEADVTLTGAQPYEALVSVVEALLKKPASRNGSHPQS